MKAKRILLFFIWIIFEVAVTLFCFVWNFFPVEDYILSFSTIALVFVTFYHALFSELMIKEERERRKEENKRIKASFGEKQIKEGLVPGIINLVAMHYSISLSLEINISSEMSIKKYIEDIKNKHTIFSKSFHDYSFLIREKLEKEVRAYLKKAENFISRIEKRKIEYEKALKREKIYTNRKTVEEEKLKIEKIKSICDDFENWIEDWKFKFKEKTEELLYLFLEEKGNTKKFIQKTFMYHDEK